MIDKQLDMMGPKDIALKVVWSAFPFILLCFVTVGNILTVFVFLRKTLRHRRGTVYLITLTIADFIAIYSGSLITKWVEFGLGRINRLSPRCNEVGQLDLFALNRRIA